MQKTKLFANFENMLRQIVWRFLFAKIGEQAKFLLIMIKDKWTAPFRETLKLTCEATVASAASWRMATISAGRPAVSVLPTTPRSNSEIKWTRADR